jgi:hypothetical protein
MKLGQGFGPEALVQFNSVITITVVTNPRLQQNECVELFIPKWLLMEQENMHFLPTEKVHYQMENQYDH